MKNRLLQILSVVMLTVLSPEAHAALLSGYSAGTGTNTASLVVDFGFLGGDSYLFEYHFDENLADPVSGEDMLLALDAAGALDVIHSFSDFGSGPQIFVQGFAFDGQSDAPDFNTTGRFWSFWTASTTPESSADWGFSNFGATQTPLADGAYHGWTLNISGFNSLGLTATNNAPATVPEPGTAAVLLVCGLALTARRRRVD